MKVDNPADSRWLFALWRSRSIGLMTVVMALSGLAAVVLAQSPARRSARVFARAIPTPLPPLPPSPGPMSPGNRTVMAPADRSVIVAPADLDPKMVLKASEAIDPTMVLDPDLDRRPAAIAVAPDSRWFAPGAPVPPADRQPRPRARPFR